MRRTGRTTRMILAAVQSALDPKQNAVIIVAVSQAHARFLNNMFVDLIEATGGFVKIEEDL